MSDDGCMTFCSSVGRMDLALARNVFSSVRILQRQTIAKNVFDKCIVLHTLGKWVDFGPDQSSYIMYPSAEYVR